VAELYLNGSRHLLSSAFVLLIAVPNSSTLGNCCEGTVQYAYAAAAPLMLSAGLDELTDKAIAVSKVQTSPLQALSYCQIRANCVAQLAV
jgi:hypothetical protein